MYELLSSSSLLLLLLLLLALLLCLAVVGVFSVPPSRPLWPLSMALDLLPPSRQTSPRPLVLPFVALAVQSSQTFLRYVYFFCHRFFSRRSLLRRLSRR